MTLKHCKLFLAAVAFLFCDSMAAAAPEYEVKAAFIYNFSRFIDWPEEPEAKKDLYFCVLGRDPFGEALENLEGREVQGRTLTIRRLERIEERGDCAIIYISPSLSGDYVALLDILSRDRGVLSISDIDGFAENGGVIELYLENNKVRFAINIEAARRTGLEMSSQLLRLARIIEGDGS
ncbi:MAG: YfiR family protein [Gammaproteobacteria bacterium]